MNFHKCLLLRPACNCEVQPILTLARTRFSLSLTPSHTGTVTVMLLPEVQGESLPRQSAPLSFQDPCSCLGKLLSNE